ncbi:MAG: 50S ribosomal protein L10 [Victivallaceae bacterium]
MKEEKGLLLREIEDKFSESQGFVLMRYSGFTADYARAFRNGLASASSEFEVVKKRLFFKALEKMSIKFDVQDSVGHLGVVFAFKDPVAVMKNVLEFSEKHDDALVFLGGQVDGVIFSSEEVLAMAKLPSLRELKMQFLGVLQASMSQMIGVVQAVLTGVLLCMEEKIKKD